LELSIHWNCKVSVSNVQRGSIAHRKAYPIQLPFAMRVRFVLPAPLMPLNFLVRWDRTVRCRGYLLQLFAKKDIFVANLV
jgi:hypothetical protein